MSLDVSALSSAGVEDRAAAGLCKPTRLCRVTVCTKPLALRLTSRHRTATWDGEWGERGRGGCGGGWGEFLFLRNATAQSMLQTDQHSPFKVTSNIPQFQCEYTVLTGLCSAPTSY